LVKLSRAVGAGPDRLLNTADHRHAGLVLVRALAERLGLPALLEEITIKQQKRGYSPAQALCETLVARALDHAFARVTRRPAPGLVDALVSRDRVPSEQLENRTLPLPLFSVGMSSHAAIGSVSPVSPWIRSSVKARWALSTWPRTRRRVVRWRAGDVGRSRCLQRTREFGIAYGS
jgi:hypothetical protein